MDEPERAVDLLRGPNRRRWRLALAAAALALVAAVAFVILRQREIDVALRLEGEGCSREPELVVRGEGGGELEVFEQRRGPVPWEATYQLHAGDRVSLGATGDSGCKLTCVIAVGGAERARAVDTGDVVCEAPVD